ncbi:unnamed protein product [Cylicocyclus nassatus]|uniref:FACT complex subunit SPT16 N-terminal lobe domain-containing protein n=1 Tax=Cylicocyclus nassatus TaxID=53992 RepID=A0AA36M1R6_CYLNA|nr:unnamed protein product [Cylicocyclus nassatus]
MGGFGEPSLLYAVATFHQEYSGNFFGFNGIEASVPVTFINESKSWIDPGPAFDIQSQRNGYVNVQIIRGAGPHVYADSPTSFNEVVQTIVNEQEKFSQSSYGLGDVEGLMVMVGQDDGAVQYSKSKAFQIWLFNTTLDTLIIFTRKGIYVLTSNRKADYFNSVKSDEFVGVVAPATPIHRGENFPFPNTLPLAIVELRVCLVQVEALVREVRCVCARAERRESMARLAVNVAKRGFSITLRNHRVRLSSQQLFDLDVTESVGEALLQSRKVKRPDLRRLQNDDEPPVKMQGPTLRRLQRDEPPIPEESSSELSYLDKEVRL